MLDALGLTHAGMEDIAAQELQQLVHAKTTEHPESVSFQANAEQLLQATYQSQSLRSMLLVLTSCKATDYAAAIQTCALTEWLPPSATFVVVCDKDDDALSSQTIAAEIGEIIQNKTQATVDFKHPSVIFSLFIRQGKAWFGIDIAGFDLSRRSYRVFLGTNSLKGNIAYSLVQLAGYTTKKSLLDPFCRHGIIPIEAALMVCHVSPHYFSKEQFAFRRLVPFVSLNLPVLFAQWDAQNNFDAPTTLIAMDDNFKFVQASKKNAQIAGVVKNIQFSRKQLEWLDLKFGEKNIDCIVSYPLQLSQRNATQFTKVINEFFYQAEYILSEKGRVVLIARQGKELVLTAAKTHHFACIAERIIWQGKEALPVLIFERC